MNAVKQHTSSIYVHNVSRYAVAKRIYIAGNRNDLPNSTKERTPT